MTQPKPQEQFFVAIIMGDLGQVQALLPENPDALSWKTPAGYPPLHMAILNRRGDIAAYLVSRGADLQEEAEGATAAALAERIGMLDRLERTQAARDIGAEIGNGLERPLQPLKKIRLRPKDPS